MKTGIEWKEVNAQWRKANISWNIDITKWEGDNSTVIITAPDAAGTMSQIKVHMDDLKTIVAAMSEDNNRGDK
jgi:hypothetical protein